MIVTISGLAIEKYENPELDQIKGNALQIRMEEQVSTQIDWRSQEEIKATLQYQYIAGYKDWYLSLNYGIDWTKAPTKYQLIFHEPERKVTLNPNKIQITQLGYKYSARYLNDSNKHNFPLCNETQSHDLECYGAALDPNH